MSGSSSKSSYPQESVASSDIEARVAHRIIDNTDDEAAAGTSSDVFVILELLPRDLKAVSARAGIVEDPLLVVPSHVLDFNLVIKGFVGHC